MLPKSKSYEEFMWIGTALDKLNGKHLWKMKKESGQYCWEKIE
jgi:hypothetical protein